jgi:hypothetical protein
MSKVTYPVCDDPTHARAYSDVAIGLVDEASVVAPCGTVLFRAWRVTPTSFAWQTATMRAPAFESITPARNN